MFRSFVIALSTLFILSAAQAQAEFVTNETATFAGGCFWCMEPEFKTEGVSKVVSGYTGGRNSNPTYQEVAFGNTGHVEAIQVTYDPALISYEKLLKIFWSNVDPLDPDGQFCDKGEQYLAGIFYHGAEQKRLAEESLKSVGEKLGKPVTTFIREAVEFYPAEDYHQEYYIKSKTRYKMYRDGCGRDKRLEELNPLIAQ